MIISIQTKSTDSRFLLNGKFYVFPDVKSLGFADGILFVNYEQDGETIEEQFKTEEISHFFAS